MRAFGRFHTNNSRMFKKIVYNLERSCILQSDSETEVDSKSEIDFLPVHLDQMPSLVWVSRTKLFNTN